MPRFYQQETTATTLFSTVVGTGQAESSDHGKAIDLPWIESSTGEFFSDKSADCKIHDVGIRVTLPASSVSVGRAPERSNRRDRLVGAVPGRIVPPHSMWIRTDGDVTDFLKASTGAISGKRKRHALVDHGTVRSADMEEFTSE